MARIFWGHWDSFSIMTKFMEIMLMERNHWHRQAGKCILKHIFTLLYFVKRIFLDCNYSNHSYYQRICGPWPLYVKCQMNAFEKQLCAMLFSCVHVCVLQLNLHRISNIIPTDPFLMDGYKNTDILSPFTCIYWHSGLHGVKVPRYIIHLSTITYEIMSEATGKGDNLIEII